MSRKYFSFRFRIFLKSELTYLVILSLFCCSLLAARMLYTSSTEYRFMATNLILAWIPYFFARVIRKTEKNTSFLLKFFLLSGWLVFFPNAPYMITDIYHLPEFPHAPQWFDLFMLLSFSWCGLLLGFYSLRMVQQRIFAKRSLRANLAFIIVLFFLCGIGIYLGRYGRWNSWQIVTDPFAFTKGIFLMVSDSSMLRQAIGIAVLSTTFLGSVYLKFFSPAAGQ